MRGRPGAGRRQAGASRAGAGRAGAGQDADEGSEWDESRRIGVGERVRNQGVDAGVVVVVGGIVVARWRSTSHECLARSRAAQPPVASAAAAAAEPPALAGPGRGATALAGGGPSATRALPGVASSAEVPNDPWTDPDPQPGDFDAELRALDPRYADRLQGSADARLTIIGDQTTARGASGLIEPDRRSPTRRRDLTRSPGVEGRGTRPRSDRARGPWT